MMSAVLNACRNGADEQLIRLVRLLEGWADWQKSFKMCVGFRTRSYSDAGCGATSFEDLCESSDASMYKTIDCAVDDLLPAQRAAVMRRYGIAAVFRFPRDNYEQQLLAAHMTLMASLPRKGVDIV